VRQDGDLLLSREDHVDPGLECDGEHLIEPGQRIGSELGYPVQCPHVPGEAGHADGIGDRSRNLVTEVVKTAGHLTGGQSRPFSEQNTHTSKYRAYAYITYK
jgi:hypothetical protein